MTPATWSMVQVFLSDAMATASIPPYVGYGRIGGPDLPQRQRDDEPDRGRRGQRAHFRYLTEEVFGQLPDDLEIPPVPAPRWACCGRSCRWRCTCSAEAQRDVRRCSTATWRPIPQRCDRRRAEIAAVDDGPELAELWTDMLEPEFHRVSWMLSAATRCSGASFVTTRKRLQQMVATRRRTRSTSGLGGRAVSWPAWACSRVSTSWPGARSTGTPSTGATGTAGRTSSRSRCPDRPRTRTGSRRARPADSPGISYAICSRRSSDSGTRPGRTWSAGHPAAGQDPAPAVAAWGRIARDREHARSEVIRYFWVLRATCSGRAS